MPNAGDFGFSIAGQLPGKSVGQATYEADVERRPLYPDGTPRKTWAELDEVRRWSWERAEKAEAETGL